MFLGPLCTTGLPPSVKNTISVLGYYVFAVGYPYIDLIVVFPKRSVFNDLLVVWSLKSLPFWTSESYSF